MGNYETRMSNKPTIIELLMRDFISVDSSQEELRNCKGCYNSNAGVFAVIFEGHKFAKPIVEPGKDDTLFQSLGFTGNQNIRVPFNGLMSFPGMLTDKTIVEYVYDQYTMSNQKPSDAVIGYYTRLASSDKFQKWNELVKEALRQRGKDLQNIAVPEFHVGSIIREIQSNKDGYDRMMIAEIERHDKGQQAPGTGNRKF